MVENMRKLEGKLEEVEQLDIFLIQLPSLKIFK